MITTSPVQHAVGHGSSLGAARLPPAIQEPAPKRSKHSKRHPTAAEDIGSISTVAEQQLCKRLFFPGHTGPLHPSALPSKKPNFSKLAMEFNEQVTNQRGLQVCNEVALSTT